jgi:hypothetical protein
MATISIQLGPETRSKTISAAHLLRFIAAYRAVYGQVPVDPQQPNGAQRDRTDAEVATAICEGIFRGWQAAVVSYEKDAAARAAATGVADLTLS